MANETTTILCGSCRIPVKGPAEPKDKDMISCPSCGRADNFKNVMASVAAFLQELVSDTLQKTIRQATRGNKVIKVTTKAIPKGKHPFIVDMKL